MKIRQTGIVAAIVLAAAAIFAACPSQPQIGANGTTEDIAQGQIKAERFQPINFEYKRASDLEKGLAAYIEGANARLGVLLSALRKGGMKEADLKEMVKNNFIGTYLANPVLRKNDGNTVVGWDDIIPELRRELGGMMYVSVHAVHILIEYIPVGSRKDPDIDFRAVIRTKLACAPTDCTWLEGEACHRNLCTWESCPGGI